MKKNTFTYPSSDGRTAIHAVSWEPDGSPRAVLQIIHGMTEYTERYEPWAQWLTERGFAVTGNDHLGHGQSVVSPDRLGYFADEDGNAKLLADISELRRITSARYPGLPYFMLGHSMGSFLLRQYICSRAEGLSGAVIMGTGSHPAAATAFAKRLCSVLARFRGWDDRSHLIRAMAFGTYNKRFGAPDGRDWLSRNRDNVERFVKDDLCMFDFTLNGYYNMFHSLNFIAKPENLAGMPRNLPVYFVSGTDDPVGSYGKDPVKIADDFRKMGMKDVSLTMYEGDRHEILNETDRLSVYGDIHNWFESHI